MAKFLNQEANPKPKASAKSNAVPAAAAPNETRIAWDNATDQGVAAQERAEIRLDSTTSAVSAGESFLAGAQSSIIAAAVRKASAPDFPADDAFDAKRVMPNDARMRAYAPDSEEIDYLHGAKSLEEYQYRTEQMLEQRTRAQSISANTVSGIAGAILGDAPLMLAPMGAAGIAGRVGLAVRSGIRAADVASAVYAADQPGQSNTVAGIVAAVSGIDQLFDMARVGRAVAQADRVQQSVDSAVSAGKRDSTNFVGRFDPDAPTKRSALDTEIAVPKDQVQRVMGKVPDVAENFKSISLKSPIKVAAGEQAQVSVGVHVVAKHLLNSSVLDDGQKALLHAAYDKLGDTVFHFTANPNTRSVYSFDPNNLADAGFIRMRASKSQAGKEWNTLGDALNSLDRDTGSVAVHEIIHAATVRGLAQNTAESKALYSELDALRNSIIQRGDAPDAVKYALTNPFEMLAELGNRPEWVDYLSKTKVGGESLLSSIGRSILHFLGFKPGDSALEQVLGVYEKLLKQTPEGTAAPTFRSSSMSELGERALKGSDESLLQGVKETLKQSFSLYDNIASGSKELADLLVSDGAAVGARRPSVADYKRNLTLEMDGAASVVEDAVVAQLRKQGVGIMDRFFHRSNFKQARNALEDKMAKYLDLAYDAEINGRPVPTPDADIAPLVQAYRDSKWASRWHDHATNSGLIDADSFPKSDYYFPRQYSYDKMRQGILSGRTLDDYRDLFRQALRDMAPDMDTDVVQRVAREMADGIYNGRNTGGGPMWRSLIQGVSNDELIQAMYSAGIDESAIQKFMRGNIAPSGGKTPPVRNLKTRTRFNMTKEYTVRGQSMRMQDLMDTDVAKVMHGYTNRMSGRVGFAYAGVSDMRKLADAIDEAKHALPDSQKWQGVVDDTIDYMLGGVIGGEMPELFRAAGNLANATMLKNSALYQITDTALAMKEFGMARVLRSMVQQPWFKEGSVVFNDRSMSSRLDSVLRGNIQKEMRFRWLNTYTDDNLDMTRSSNWFNVTQNVGQSARHVNGMSMVHRAQVNFNAGIVMDELTQMLKGDADAITRLEKYGLSRDEMKAMQTAHSANPGKMLPPELQMKMEIAGTRMMDYVVQQVRTGETSYFAQLNPVGRVIIGYQSFALAATNKILRRTLNDGGPLSLMHLMAYQFPLMLLASQAKAAADGKLGEADSRKIITEAVLGMSAIGGLSLLSQVFTGDTPRHSLAGMGYVTAALGAVQDVASGKADAQSLSRVLPLAQEFLPTRAIINNYGDE